MTGDRRPLASRNARWAQALARRLSASRVTPNRISQGSLLFAAAAAGFYGLALRPGAAPVALFLAALCIQGRLLCNLLDGMVAVEGGKGGPDGAFWNEVPDRPADLLILGGAGLAAGLPWLGLLAAAGALGTAYLRAFGTALGLPADFSGPMAKPQRMAVLTAASLLGAVEAGLRGSHWTLAAGLAVVVLGAAVTCWRRGRRILAALRGT